MLCPVCGQRHANREEAAMVHSPRVLPKTEGIILPATISQRSKAEPKKETGNSQEVKYRGRRYTGILKGNEVEITLKSGEKRYVRTVRKGM